jgi:predicted nucleic-acid-binding Zn-ribbon protein
MPDTNCPKCKGEMEPGSIPDAGYTVVRWHPDSEPKGFFAGLKKLRTSGYRLAASRCKQCGFMEFYGVGP